jgi:hypothetical protein
LKTTPTLPNTLRSWPSEQDGQSVSDGSWIDWTTSSGALQLVHTYS